MTNTEMEKLVQHLRREEEFEAADLVVGAMSTIESLQVDNERLRGALREIADWPWPIPRSPGEALHHSGAVREIAKAALSQTRD